MNKDRRKAIGEAVDLLNKLEQDLARAKEIIGDAASAEREFYDNMPENMQSGDKGQQADNAASQLEEAQSTLEDLDISDIVGKLEDAQA